MPVSLTDSKDIIANSVSILDANDILNMMDLIGSISRIIASVVGNPPITLNTIPEASQCHQ